MNIPASHSFSSQEGPAPSGFSARVEVAWTIAMFGPIRAPQVRWWVLTTCAALGVLAPGEAGAAPCVLPSGLVAWWPGDGSGADLVRSNALSLFQGATYGPGQVGQALVFDGVNDRAQLPDVEALRLGKSLTIEGWIYRILQDQTWA